MALAKPSVALAKPNLSQGPSLGANQDPCRGLSQAGAGAGMLHPEVGRLAYMTSIHIYIYIYINTYTNPYIGFFAS